ncbi:MAG: retron St85 family effector protein [Deltaproteobacteria bacterium]|jgi:hypothetical protein|nr:retron St85 family effector protein [Deltaproteobacteria bacterium]
MIEPLAKKIHNEVYKVFFDYKTTLFLCGAGNEVVGSVRKQINDELTSSRYAFHYDMFYPEDLFGELLFGPKHQDLLSLENILADSVDAIVLIIESFGAVAELGAFASNSKLRKKIVCLVDQKYRKKKSFINYGPLRLLKDKGEGQVVYVEYDNISKSIKAVRRAISKTRKLKRKKPDVKNVVQAHHYILPCIYLLEPVKRNILRKLVEHASGTNDQKSTALTAGAISILNKKREISLTPDGYRLTPTGLISFSNLGSRGRTRQVYNITAMDEMRVAILNWKYRGKQLKL